jgi:lysophospholipase L1-like esterase
MARLFTFGCSITVGEALPDTVTKAGKQIDGPSKYAWPQLLGEKLNLSVANLGQGAASNKYICKRMLDTNLRSDDTVVFMWSYFARTCFFENQKDYKRIIPGHLNWHVTKGKQLKQIREDIRYCKDFYNNYFTWYNAFYESYQQMNFAKMYLDSKGIANYHTTCETLPYTGIKEKKLHWFKFFSENKHTEIKFAVPSWNTVDLHQIDLYDHGALDNDHPSVDAHKKMAEDIYNIIKA